jgi:hypothetical protein
MTLHDDTLGLTDYRQQLAAVLVAGLPADVAVWDSIPDSIAPPSVYVTWANPWLVPTTWCDYTVQCQILAVAQRIEPGGQYSVLESLIAQILATLKANRIAIRDVSAPYPLVLAGVNYLAASINVPNETG